MVNLFFLTNKYTCYIQPTLNQLVFLTKIKHKADILNIYITKYPRNNFYILFKK